MGKQIVDEQAQRMISIPLAAGRKGRNINADSEARGILVGIGVLIINAVRRNPADVGGRTAEGIDLEGIAQCIGGAGLQTLNLPVEGVNVGFKPRLLFFSGKTFVLPGRIPQLPLRFDGFPANAMSDIGRGQIAQTYG